MEEQQIQEKLPVLYEFLSATTLNIQSWQEIHQDLSDLQWLDMQNGDEDKIIAGILSICDRLGLGLLNKTSRFQTHEINSVKLFIHDAIYNLVSNKDKVKEICSTSKKIVGDMEFFKLAGLRLEKADGDSLVEVAVEIEAAYKEFKKVMTDVTMQLDKSIQSEYEKSFGDLLDEIFYSESLSRKKSEMKEKSETERILQLYKGNRYYSSKFSGGYYNFFPKGENIYIGEVNFLGKKEGYGKMYYVNKDVYEGIWKNDKPEGKGLYLWKDGGKYLGDFRQGQMHGYGKRLYSSGSFYEGEFSNGKRSGKGKMVFKNGDEYDGEWNDEDMQGWGMYKWASGDTYIGGFKRDKRDGKGTLTLSTGETYVGEWDGGSMKKEEKEKETPI